MEYSQMIQLRYLLLRCREQITLTEKSCFQMGKQVTPLSGLINLTVTPTVRNQYFFLENSTLPFKIITFIIFSNDPVKELELRYLLIRRRCHDYPHLKVMFLDGRSSLFRKQVTPLSGLINLIVTPTVRNQYFFSENSTLPFKIITFIIFSNDPVKDLELRYLLIRCCEMITLT